MINHYLSGNPVHDRVIEAFYEGCPEEKKLIRGFEYEPSDVAVVFGVYKSRVPQSFQRGRVIHQQRSKNRDVVVLETGYVNRGDGENHHYAAGLNGLNGRADFKNKNSPSDRFEKLGITVKPWKEGGDYIILCGQVPWDASVDHVDFRAWTAKATQCIHEFTKRPILYREHPCISGESVLLTNDLPDAWSVVTFNSNSAVEAAIEGVPVFAFDGGSMAWEIASHSYAEMEHRRKPDRRQWLCDLAYTQWTPEEMRNGEAWRHLFR